MEPFPEVAVPSSPSRRPTSGSLWTKAQWLTLRVRADDAARAVTAARLLPPLIDHLTTGGARDSGLEVIDLGAGTGANQRWLAPKLPFHQRWLWIDQNPTWQTSQPLPAQTRFVAADIGVLGSILHEAGGARLVTCSALLDLLTAPQLETLGANLTDARVPALFSLTVTGSMNLSPRHPLDAHILEAFNDHQRRADRTGHQAVATFVQMLDPTHFSVRTAETPWLLGPDDDPAFVRQFLQDRAAAAVDEDRSLGSVGEAWLKLRLAQLSAGALRIDVGHRDILILPR